MSALDQLRHSYWALRKTAAKAGPIVLKSRGRCPTCDKDTAFVARDSWLRDHYLCASCGSIPRERALMHVIDTHFPAWRTMTIHESSPSARGASLRLAAHCPGYVGSQYFPDGTPGSMVGPFRCENLEALTFADESIDLHVTQDVLEHIFHPERMFRELARTLKPGGAHVFTVPLVNRHEPSRRRARLTPRGEVVHLAPAQYHGNPVSDDGALVTFDWGYDIVRAIHEASGLFTHVIHIDDTRMGIRAELIEVLITYKPAESVTDFDS